MKPLRGRLLVMFCLLGLLVLITGCRGNGADDADAKQAQSTSATSAPPASDRAAGGEDRAEPRMVTTLDQLQAMKADLNGHYSLANDIADSYSAGEVIGQNNVGGLVGLTVEGSIANSFSSGVVTGNREVGGLVGYHNGGTTTASYSKTEVVGTHFNIGGLVGEQHDEGEEPLRSYWDVDKAGLPEPGDDLGEAKTTVEMMQASTFVDWDFSETWTIIEDGDYPDLIDNTRSR